MINEVVMPKLGETMTEGTILRWIKKEGETVEKGEPLLEVMTDKVNIEVESFVKGTVRKILIPEGEAVAVLAPIALIGDPSDPLPDLSRYQRGGEKKGVGLEVKKEEVKEEKVAVALGPGEKRSVSPRARKLAEEKGVDLALVTGTGPGGRITEKDVLNFLEFRLKVTPVAMELARQMGIELGQLKGTGPQGKILKEDVIQAVEEKKKAAEEKKKMVEVRVPEKEEKAVAAEIIPLSPTRRIIARKMAESKATIPHYYLSVEIDMTEAVKLRTSLAGNLAKEEKVPSYHDFFIKAAAMALEEYPRINVRFVDDKIQILSQINIGLAVALPEGLIVPVVRQANRKSLMEISRETQDLVSRARDNKLKLEDVGDASITVSNLGMYGVDCFVAVINPPESTILALGRIALKPWVVNGEIAVRSMMTATLSCDHRVIDGALSGQFLQRLKTILENPYLLLWK